MAREMVAMWRTANGLVGVPGQVSHPGVRCDVEPADETTPESARSRSGWRSWMPSLERTPPLVQFIVRLARWLKTKCQAGVTPDPAIAPGRTTGIGSEASSFPGGSGWRAISGRGRRGARHGDCSNSDCGHNPDGEPAKCSAAAFSYESTRHYFCWRRLRWWSRQRTDCA